MFFSRKGADERISKGFALASEGRHADALRWYDEALLYFDRALSLDPGQTAVIAAKGDAFRELKQYKRAVDCYTQCLGAGPEDTRILGAMGEALTELGRIGEAKRCFDKTEYLSGKAGESRVRVPTHPRPVTARHGTLLPAGRRRKKSYIELLPFIGRHPRGSKKLRLVRPIKEGRPRYSSRSEDRRTDNSAMSWVR